MSFVSPIIVLSSLLASVAVPAPKIEAATTLHPLAASHLLLLADGSGDCKSDDCPSPPRGGGRT